MLKNSYRNVMGLLSLGKIGMLTLCKVYVKITLSKPSTRRCSQMRARVTGHADAPGDTHVWELESWELDLK